MSDKERHVYEIKPKNIGTVYVEAETPAQAKAHALKETTVTRLNGGRIRELYESGASIQVVGQVTQDNLPLNADGQAETAEG